MKRFKPEDPLWSILSMLHSALLTGTAPSKLPICPFCGGSCGQTVRECAEMRGSRKQLKHKIRELERPLRFNEDRVRELKTERERMTRAGINTVNDQDRLQEVANEINSCERLVENAKPALELLYQAYLSVSLGSSGVEGCGLMCFSGRTRYRLKAMGMDNAW